MRNTLTNKNITHTLLMFTGDNQLDETSS